MHEMFTYLAARVNSVLYAGLTIPLDTDVPALYSDNDKQLVYPSDINYPINNKSQ